MTKAELVAAMAEKSGLNRAQTRDALDAFIGCIAETVRSGQEVRIVGFGNFVPVDRPAGVARNPRTGAQVKRAASKSIRFRAGEGLKGVLN